MKNRNLNHKDNWRTPPKFYEELNQIFDFDCDPCPYDNDIEKWDGLTGEWGKRNYINPPYSRALKEAFIKKAIEESRKGKLCVMLLPVSTSTAIFHDYILPNAKEIKFVRGRIPFIGENERGQIVNDPDFLRKENPKNEWDMKVGVPIEVDGETHFKSYNLYTRGAGQHDSMIVVFSGKPIMGGF